MLEKNLKYAKETLLHCSTVLPLGAANVPNAKVAGSEIIQMRESVRQEIQYDYESSSELPLLTLFAEARIVDLRAKRYKCGNCFEQAVVAFIYLHDIKKLSKIDLVSVIGGDHAFLVIGRAEGSNINDNTTWGDDAVICDPWGQCYYPAQDLDFHLNETLINNHFPPFCSKTQSIGNLYDCNPRDAIEGKILDRNPPSPLHRKERAKIAEEIRTELNVSDHWLNWHLNEYIMTNSQEKKPPELSLEDNGLVSNQYQQYISSFGSTQKGLQYKRLYQATSTYGPILEPAGMIGLGSSVLRYGLRKKCSPYIVGGAITSLCIGKASQYIGGFFKNKSDDLLRNSRNIWKNEAANTAQANPTLDCLPDASSVEPKSPGLRPS